MNSLRLFKFLISIGTFIYAQNGFTQAASPPDAVPRFLSGKAQVTATGTERGYDKARGFGMLIRTRSGAHVQTFFAGLQPGLAYPSHVHNSPCAVNGGGGHFKFDTTVVAPVESNEIWLNFTSNSHGMGGARVLVNQAVGPDAQSIVLHDATADKARIMCIDLVPMSKESDD